MINYLHAIKKQWALIVGYFKTLRMQISKVLGWVGTIFFGFIAFFTVAFLYIVSIPVPAFGRLLIESNSKVELSDSNLHERVNHFREDVLELIGNHHNASSGRSKASIETEIELLYQKAKMKHELGELFISFHGGILALLLGYFGYWEYLSYTLSFYILILIVSIVVRLVVIDMLAFSRDLNDGYITLKEMELRLGWQRVVLKRSRTQLMILFLAFLSLVRGPGYGIAMNRLDSYIEQRI